MLYCDPGGVGQQSHSQGCGTIQGWLKSESCSLMRLLAGRELTNYIVTVSDTVNFIRPYLILQGKGKGGRHGLREEKFL